MTAHQRWLSDLRRERVALGLAVDWRKVIFIGLVGAALVVAAWSAS